jgi:hypothetical protein
MDREAGTINGITGEVEMTAIRARATGSWGVSIACAAALVAAACSGDDEGGTGENPFDNPTAGSSAGSGGSSGAGGAGSGGTGGRSGASGGSSGSGGGGNLVGDAACKHVDLVIAVDGSSSMTEELEAMRDEIFPAFAQRLGTLGAELDDFRVATLDACPTPANFHTRGAGGECNFSSGQSWIESDSPAIAAEFACVGDIFLEDQQCSGENDDEQPATSAIAALQAGGPNSGFRRDDALLIVVAITDEDEQPTGDSDNPEDIYRDLVALTAGDPRRMVFLGIGGEEECQGEYGDAEEADGLQELTDLFEVHDRGVFWDLCQGRLEDGLDEAFRVIENACNDLCGDLDEDCGGEPPEPGFCEMFPSDPICAPI